MAQRASPGAAANRQQSASEQVRARECCLALPGLKTTSHVRLGTPGIAAKHGLWLRIATRGKPAGSVRSQKLSCSLSTRDCSLSGKLPTIWLRKEKMSKVPGLSRSAREGCEYLFRFASPIIPRPTGDYWTDNAQRVSSAQPIILLATLPASSHVADQKHHFKVQGFGLLIWAVQYLLGHDAGSYGHGATTKPTLSCDRLSLGLEASGHVLSSGAHGRIDLHLSGFLRVPGEQTRVTRFFLEVSALRKCLALKSCTGQTGFSGTSYSN